jgi:hypothetical protein
MTITQNAQLSLGLSGNQLALFEALRNVGGSISQAAEALGRLKNLQQGLAALEAAGLIVCKGDQADLSPADTVLRALWEEEQPEIDLGPGPVTLRPLTHRLLGIIRSAKTPVGGLGAVYSFLFGGELQKAEWGTIAAYTKQSGGAEAAALFFLEHVTDGLRNPLKELLPLFISSRVPYRPDTAPTDEELQAQQWALFESGWRARMIANTPTEYDLTVWASLGKPTF